MSLNAHAAIFLLVFRKTPETLTQPTHPPVR